MRSNLWLSAAVVIARLLTAHGNASRQPAEQVLPQPPGTFGIGRLTFHWTDTKRRDPFWADPAIRRELMVHVWYPAPAKKQATLFEPYLPGAAVIDAAPGTESIDRMFGSAWPLIAAGEVTSHAQRDAPVAGGPARFPIVLFSHGDGALGFGYTIAIENLVSHGYVVAAIEHPYASAAVVLSSGRVVRFSERRTLRGDRPPGLPCFEGLEIAMADMRRLTDIHAADLRFVLDQLEALERASTLSGGLDFLRVAAVGHSAGGRAAIRACQLDDRIKACVNLDGGSADGIFLQYAGALSPAEPLLFVQTSGPPSFSDRQLAERGLTRDEWTKNANDVAATQERQLEASGGGSYRVELRAPGMAHNSFSDAPLFASDGPEARRRALHNVALAADVVRFFLDEHLEGQRKALLTRLGQDNGDVKVTRD